MRVGIHIQTFSFWDHSRGRNGPVSTELSLCAQPCSTSTCASGVVPPLEEHSGTTLATLRLFYAVNESYLLQRCKDVEELIVGDTSVQDAGLPTRPCTRSTPDLLVRQRFLCVLEDGHHLLHTLLCLTSDDCDRAHVLTR